MSGITAQLSKPFSIGKTQFAHRLIQGPLAGISCAPFRSLFADYCLPAYAVTEMISAQFLVTGKNSRPRFVARAENEAPLCYQLSGRDPQMMAKAVKMVDELGADVIDLNAGCPKPKIRQKSSGSAHIDNPSLLADMVSSMRAATDKPLTVKIRTQGRSHDKAYLEAAKVIEDSGADAIIVHGRHWTEDYDVPCNYEQIALIKSRLSIPVIANGDLSCRTSIARSLSITGCDAYMIARAGIGQPWLYQKLLSNDDLVITLKEKIDLFLMHVNGLADIEVSEKIALLQARRLLKHYFQHDIAKDEIIDLYQCDTIKSLDVSVNKWLE